MNDFLFFLLYATGIFFVVGGYVFYLQLSRLPWDESEIRFLERFELHLAHILPLLEAPDVHMLLRCHGSRQRLFLEFSSDLKEDMVQLWQPRKLELTTLFFVAIFSVSYYGMRVRPRRSSAVYAGCSTNLR